MPKPPPENLLEWSKADLAKELSRLRAILREHAERPGTDPKAAQAPNSIVDVAGDPFAIGGALIDARSAVLLESVEVVMIDTMQSEMPHCMLRLQGRVNFSTDYVDHAYLFDPDGSAAIVSELVGLAARESAEFAKEFQERLDQRLKELP